MEIDLLSDLIPKINPSSLLVNTVVINRAGVMSIDSGGDIHINSESVSSAVESAIYDLKPKRDYNGCYAAKLTVVVQLIGDMEARDENT